MDNKSGNSDKDIFGEKYILKYMEGHGNCDLGQKYLTKYLIGQ